MSKFARTAAGFTALGVVVALYAAGPAAAEEVAQKCPTLAEQKSALATTPPGGQAKPSVQPVETHGVLASAGGSGSAAPTVQQNGQSVKTGIDCPMAPGHPNALPPGDKSAAMPKQSTP